MKCEKCKKEFKQNKLEVHHIIPKKFRGTDKDGRMILCIKHHKEIQKIIFDLNIKDKKKIKEFTKAWLEESPEKIEPPCPMCKDLKKKMHIFTNHSNYLILKCSGCGYEEKNYSYFNQWLGKQLKEDFKSGDDSSISEF